MAKAAQTASKPAGPHGFWTKVFYGFGSVAYGVKDNGFSVLLLIYYNQVLGLSAARAGFALMLALVIDSVVDPTVGHLSDNLRSRWGRRHPFMYAAAIPTALAYFFLWYPPASLSQDGLFGYLLVMAILVRSLITCYEIPSSALVAELTEDYDERTSYLSYRYFFGWWGGLTMQLLAFSVFLKATPKYPVGQLNPEGYKHYAIAACIIMLLGVLVSSLGTHRTIPFLKNPPPPRRLTFSRSLKEIFETISERSALALLGTGTLILATAGVIFSLSTYISTYFWLLRPGDIALLTFASFFAAAIALTITPPLSKRFGKKRTAIAAALLAIVITPLLIVLRLAGVVPAGDVRFAIPWLGSPGAPFTMPVVLPLIFAQLVVTTTLGIINPILVSAMIADVVEQNEIRTGRRTEGVLFAANAFMGKCVTGLGIFISTMILSAVDFPAKAVPGQVAPDILMRLVVIYSVVIAVTFGAATACLFAFRISRERHEANLKTLEALAVELPEVGPPVARLS